MNKKASSWEDISIPNLIALVLTLIALTGFSIIGFRLYHHFTKDSSIPEQQVNRLRIVAAQINALPVENDQVIIPIKIWEIEEGIFEKERYYQIELYSKCKSEEKPGDSCKLKPQICIKDITDKEGSKIKPYCEEIEDANFEETKRIPANRYLKVDKEETKDGIIIKIA